MRYPVVADKNFALILSPSKDEIAPNDGL